MGSRRLGQDAWPVRLTNVSVIVGDMVFLCGETAKMRTVNDVMAFLSPQFAFSCVEVRSASSIERSETFFRLLYSQLTPIDVQGTQLVPNDPVARLAAVRLSIQPYVPDVNMTTPEQKSELIVHSPFDPPSRDYLRLTPGDKVIDVAAVDDIWWYGKAKSREGLFPRVKVAPINEVLYAARAQSNSEAQYELGMRFLHGCGGAKQNDTKGAALLIESAEARNVDAICALGVLYRDGGNGPTLTTDHEVARSYLEYAATRGHAIAIYELGVHYQRSSGMEATTHTPVMREALECFRRAAFLGYAQAQFHLACLHRRQSPPDYQRAFPLLRGAADQGLPEAQRLLGKCFERGEGCVKSASKSMAWMRAAAACGDTSAMAPRPSRSVTGQSAKRKSGLKVRPNLTKKSRSVGADRPL